MLEIVAKRAALRPPETVNSSLQSEPVSLPVLPPQTTINPLLQHLHGYSSPSSCYSSIMTGQRNNIHTFPSQSHNQEHEVSDDFLFDGTEHYYLCTNESLLHDCHILMEILMSFNDVNNHNPDTQFTPISISNAHVTRRRWFNRQVVLVIVEFLVLYAAVLYYSFSQD
jgi:hypothetical protein